MSSSVGGELLAAFLPLAFGRVADSTDTGRLLDHDHVVIQVADDDLLRLPRRGGGTVEYLDELAVVNAPGRVEAQFTTHAPCRVSMRRRTWLHDWPGNRCRNKAARVRSSCSVATVKVSAGIVMPI